MAFMQITSLRPPAWSVSISSNVRSSRTSALGLVTQCSSRALENSSSWKLINDGVGLRGSCLHNHISKLRKQKSLRTVGVANAGLSAPQSVAGKWNFFPNLGQIVSHSLYRCMS